MTYADPDRVGLHYAVDHAYLTAIRRHSHLHFVTPTAADAASPYLLPGQRLTINDVEFEIVRMITSRREMLDRGVSAEWLDRDGNWDACTWAEVREVTTA